MKSPDSRNLHGFHELPLVLFTTLAILGAGLAGSWLSFGLMGWVPLVPPSRIMMTVAVLLGSGFLISAGHLGRRFRGHIALVGVGRSALSNEVLLLSLAFLFSAASIGVADDPVHYGILSMAGLAFSVLLLPVLAAVYNLPGQLSWTGPALIQPLVLGLGVGFTFLLRELPPGATARGELIVLVFLMMDGLLVWERTRRLAGAREQGLPVHPELHRHRGLLIGLRLVLGLLAPALALLWSRWDLVMLSLFSNLLLDRVMFYGLALRESTEAGLMRVRAVLEAESNKT